MKIKDPVCRKEIDVQPDTPRVEDCPCCEGENTVYFCSDNCREKFLGDPSLYHQVCHG
ncbi:hypothetical protein GF325_07885|nr:hypothetical protein [Candidatus Bathyarchaeota archaeon]